MKSINKRFLNYSIVALPFVVAFFMILLSWNKWLHHSIDSYLSLHIFQLIDAGNLLYSMEAPYFYGPLIPYIYSFILSFFQDKIFAINILGVFQFYLLLALFYKVIQTFFSNALATFTTTIFVLLFGITAVNSFEAHTLVVAYNIVSSYALTFILLTLLGYLKQDRLLLNLGILLLTLTRFEQGVLAMVLFFPYKKFSYTDFIVPAVSLTIYSLFAFFVGLQNLISNNLFWAPHITTTPWTQEIFYNGDLKATLLSLLEATLIFLTLRYKKLYLVGAVFLFSLATLFLYDVGSVIAFLSFLGVLLFFKERSLPLLFALLLVAKLFFSLSLNYYAFYLAPPLFILFLYSLRKEKKAFTLLLIAAIFLPKVILVFSKTVPFFLEQRESLTGEIGTQTYLTSREHAFFYAQLVLNLKNSKPNSLLCLPDCVSLNDQLKIPSLPVIPNLAYSAYPLVKEKLTREILEKKPEVIILLNEDSRFRGVLKNWFTDHLQDFLSRIESDYQIVVTRKSNYAHLSFVRSDLLILQRKESSL